MVAKNALHLGIDIPRDSNKNVLPITIAGNVSATR